MLSECKLVERFNRQDALDSRGWEYPIASSEDCRDGAFNVITSLGGS